MARFNDYDPATPICADWLNMVDATVVSGLGMADTPEEVLDFIGAVEEAPDDGQIYGRQSLAWAPVPSDHALLDHRDYPDSHPMEAVTGLPEALAAKAGLTQTQTFYVSPLGVPSPDNPEMGDPFDHPQTALAWLRTYMVPPKSTITILVAAGFYSMDGRDDEWEIPPGVHVRVVGEGLRGNAPSGVAGCSWATDPLAPVPVARGADELYNTAGQLSIDATDTTRGTARDADWTNNRNLWLGTGTTYTGGRWSVVIGYPTDSTTAQPVMTLGRSGLYSSTGVVSFENIAFAGPPTSGQRAVDIRTGAFADFLSCAFAGGNAGVQVFVGGVATLRDCALFGARGNGLYTNGVVSLDRCIIQGAPTGVLVLAGGAVSTNSTTACTISGCRYAVAVQQGGVFSGLGTTNVVTGCENGLYNLGGLPSYLGAARVAGISSPLHAINATNGATITTMEGVNNPIYLHASAGRFVISTIKAALKPMHLQTSKAEFASSGAGDYENRSSTTFRVQLIRGSELTASFGTMTHSGTAKTLSATGGSVINTGNDATLTYSPAYNTVGNYNSIITGI